MRLNVWLVLIMLFSNNIFGQISKKVAEIIKPLESYEYIHTLDDDIHKIETEVQKMATSDELIFLAIHGKNPYVMEYRLPFKPETPAKSSHGG